MEEVRMLQAGEQALIVEFGSTIDAGVNARVHRLAKRLMTDNDGAVIEVVPTYRSLLVYFNPLRTKRSDLQARIEAMLADAGAAAPGEEAAKVVHIPVCYGGEFGPDLDFVAQHNGLSAQEVVRIHTSTPYLVYMLGFTPGFPYLGGMSEKIATPRLEKPRTKIPPGSVGIAGSQTGFYPIESPGGWRLIGRTPVKAFNPVTNAFLFAAGDYLQFFAVTVEEYESIQGKVAVGDYTPTVSYLKPVGGDK